MERNKEKISFLTKGLYKIAAVWLIGIGFILMCGFSENQQRVYDYGEVYTQSSFVRSFKKPGVQLGAAAIMAAIGVLILYSGRKTKVTINSRTYLRGNQNEVLEKHDNYIRTTTVTRKIERSSSGKGGSTHTASSGKSHGGGGGKF